MEEPAFSRILRAAAVPKPKANRAMKHSRSGYDGWMAGQGLELTATGAQASGKREF